MILDDFYNGFFNCSTQEATDFKINYLKTIIENDTIYKFIQFDNNSIMNNKKIASLSHETLWFGHHRYLNDPTEYEMKYNAKKIRSKTGCPVESIKFAFGTIKDLYELCSFTYAYDNYMWDTYSRNGNGICLKLKVQNYDMLYPVIYREKNKFDFTKMIIDSIENLRTPNKMHSMEPIALLPFILKNPLNGYLDSTKEKEIRILYAPTDKSEFNNGVLYPNAKQEHNYAGINVSMKTLGLSINTVIIGNKCEESIVNKLLSVCNDKQYLVCYR